MVLLIEEYMTIQRQYQAKFGLKTVLAMEVGSFFEIYEWKGEGFATEISQVLSLQLATKDKESAHGVVLMCGFPPASYFRYRDALLASGYTVVLFKQEKLEHGKIERKLLEVVSASTNVDSARSNRILFLYVDVQAYKQRPPCDYQAIVGLAEIDVTTGRNSLGETYSKPEDPGFVWEETCRAILGIQPYQILVCVAGLPCGEPRTEFGAYLSSRLPLSLSQRVQDVEFDPKHGQLVFQRESVDRLGLDPDLLVTGRYALAAYLGLLSFVSGYNPTLADNLAPPNRDVFREDRHLVLANNALLQLNVLPTGQPGKKADRGSRTLDSLFSLVDENSTELGRRMLRGMLSRPMTDPLEIERHYEMTSELLSMPDLVRTIETSLRKMPDVERLQRKVALKLIRPVEVAALLRAYEELAGLYAAVYESPCTAVRSCLLSEETASRFNELLRFAFSSVDLDALERVRTAKDALDVGQVFTLPGADAEMDAVRERLRTAEDKVQRCIAHMNSMLSGAKGKGVRLVLPNSERKKEEEADVRCLIASTPKQASTLLASPYDRRLVGALKAESTRKKEERSLTSDVVGPLLAELEQTMTLLGSASTHYYYERFLPELGRRLDSRLALDIVRLISQLDYAKSSAVVARRWKYHRPKLEQGEASHLRAQEVRHPIIEQIVRHPYVPNDLELSSSGMLLFSSNACGKSSLTKAVGLCVILAQCGLYVPAKLSFRPYARILTRLSGTDDLFEGRSSFEVEMDEVHVILKGADRNSLVLMDEVTRGSELVSGSAISLALLEHLLAVRASFIFPTHLHNLLRTEQMKALAANERLRICHLSATYDASRDRLVYERKLKDGPGPSVYGLEVCRSLHMPQAFVKRANEIRLTMCDDPTLLPSGAPSRYNSSLLVERCSDCGTKLSLETHHVAEQHKADADGYIGIHHKNRSYNLRVLCRACHERQHAKS